MKRLERLAVVITELDPGGAERWATSLIEYLRRHGRQVAVFALGSEPQEYRRELVERLEAVDVPITFFGARRWWQTPGLIKRVRAALSDFQPDVVQSFLFHANTIAAQAVKRLSCPLVTSIRVADPRGWRWWIEGFASRRIARCVCVSDDVARIAALHWPRLAGRLVVLPNGVDVERFAKAEPASPESLGLDPNRPTVTFIGRYDPQKNLDWLLDFWNAVLPDWVMAEELGELRWPQLLLVGDKHYELVAPRGTTHEPMVGHGRVRDVAGILKASDIIVLPSIWEGLPNVVLEAMAASKPIIANDVHGVRQALGPDAGEQIVPTDDRERWEASLRVLLSNPKRAQELGQQNQRRVLEHFTMEACCDRYVRLYESLLQ
jgi:glycosyltransferase involved in cell wall biosynthesis